MKSSLLLVWSAAWRAQVSHLAVFTLLPGIAAAVHIALGVVLLPFLLIGFGAGKHDLGPEVAHLASPGCWVALAPCSFAEKSFLPLPGTPAASDTQAEPFLPLPTALNVRHLWFAAWLCWFLVHLVRRERPGSAA